VYSKFAPLKALLNPKSASCRESHEDSSVQLVPTDFERKFIIQQEIFRLKITVKRLCPSQGSWFAVTDVPHPGNGSNPPLREMIDMRT